MSTPGQPASIATRVRIDRLQLLYRMSFPAVSFGLLVSCLLAAALWQQAERSRIEIWLAMVFGTTLIRAALFIGYRRVQPSGEAILAWEKPYVATLLLASLTWGAGAVWIMPANSAFHQAVTCYFLMGMAGGAALMYSVVRGMVIATLFALLGPVTAWMLVRGDPAMLAMSAAACVFVVSAVRSIGLLSATAQQNFEMTYALEQARDSAEKMAGSDPLTGLPNRRAFFEQARALLGMCRRNALPVAVLVIDIDHFKRINDTRGHAMGDFALRHLAHLMQSGVRVSDLCCRLGGEEFAVLLPNTSPQAAHGLAEKLRERIAAHPVELPGEALRITASLGVAHGEGELEALLDAADAAMYAAKKGGRNRVVTAASGVG